MSVAEKNPEVKTQPRVMVIESIEKRDSGYVRTDTKGTRHEEKIDCPSVIFIPNRGKIAKKTVINGKETIIYVKARYIKGCSEIEEQKQKELGIDIKDLLPSDSVIQLDKGVRMIREEGDLALFAYLENVLYNENAPNRQGSKAKAIFKVVEVDQKNESLNQRSFLTAEAVGYVASLVLKVGKDSFKYKESKIDNILQVLNEAGGEGYAEKVNTLTRLAELNPTKFLQTVKSLENTIVTEITEALELNVIQLTAKTAEFVEDKKMLANFGEVKLKKEKQIETLADLLRTPEYAAAYQELKAKIEIAQENQFKN